MSITALFLTRIGAICFTIVVGMKFLSKFNQKKERMIFVLFIAFILVSAFLIGVLNNERQDRRTKAVEVITKPGTYSTGNYSNGGYSGGSSSATVVPSVSPTM